MPDLRIISAVNNEKILKENLLRSPMIADNSVTAIIIKGYDSASKAYNSWLKHNTESKGYAIFAHQDVYFPEGWDKRLLTAIKTLNYTKTLWAVLGVWGICSTGRFFGKVWCNGGNKEHSGTLDGVEEAVSVDEIVIVLNTASNIKFDERLPGFHLYATDIILEAKRQGYKSFVFDGPVIHNSKNNPQVFDSAYFQAYCYMKKKWTSLLPLQTCVVPVTRFSLPLYKAWFRNEANKRLKRLRVTESEVDSEMMAIKLGYNLSS